jgi:chorismate synthase
VLRFLTAGDSHGEALLGILEGFPSQVSVSDEEISRDLARRQLGYGRSERMKTEKDRVRILSGIWKGRTTGSPIGLIIENRARHGEGSLPTRLGSVPRPGHADLAACQKYGFKDVEPVSERASARETAMRVAVGSLAKLLLEALPVDFFSHVIQIAGVPAPPCKGLSASLRRRVERSPIRCADIRAAKSMMRQIELAGKSGDSLGGAIEVVVHNVPPGLGSYVHYDRRLDARIASAVMSIPSVKGVEIGNAIEVSKLRGSRAHDEMRPSRKGSVGRVANNAGGIEGGVSNGEPVVVRAFVKPIPTMAKPLRSIDMKTRRPARAPSVRADVCVVPSVAVIAEAMIAFELAQAVCEKFGGDSVGEMRRNYVSYMKAIDKRQKGRESR